MRIPNDTLAFEETIITATINGLTGGLVGYLAGRSITLITSLYPNAASYTTIFLGSLTALRVISRAKLPSSYKACAALGLALTTLTMTATVIATAPPIKQTLLHLL